MRVRPEAERVGADAGPCSHVVGFEADERSIEREGVDLRDGIQPGLDPTPPRGSLGVEVLDLDDDRQLVLLQRGFVYRRPPLREQIVGAAQRLPQGVAHVRHDGLQHQRHRLPDFLQYGTRLRAIVRQTRVDLGLPALRWFVSQQAPTDHERVNAIDVTSELMELAASDEHLVHVRAFDPPPQERALVFDTAGVVWLGELLASAYLARD